MREGKKVLNDKQNNLDEKKIASLQEMISNAEQTIFSAKQMLAKMNGAGFANPKKSTPESMDSGRVIYGGFDGQVMIGEDGKQYPVPANYSSKSKLVEGDVMKLTITDQGSFIYKQVGPVERKYLIGIAQNNNRGTLIVHAENKDYRVLLAAATYFKIEPGDEVTLVVPRDKSSEWAAIENVLRKADETLEKNFSLDNLKKYSQMDAILEEKKARKEQPEEIDNDEIHRESAVEKLAKEMEEERKKRTYGEDLLDEWTPDIEKIRQEIKQPVETTNEN